MWQKHPVEMCARMQAVFDLRNATTRETLCNYDGANSKTQVSFSQQNIIGSFLALLCIAAYQIFYCKTKLRGNSRVKALLGILTDYKDVFHGADVNMMMGK